VGTGDLPERTDQSDEHQTEGESDCQAVRWGAGGGLAQGSSPRRRGTREDQEKGADHLREAGPQHVRRVDPVAVQPIVGPDTRAPAHGRTRFDNGIWRLYPAV